MPQPFDCLRDSLIAALTTVAGFALAGGPSTNKIGGPSTNKIEGSFYQAGPGCDGDHLKPCKVNIQVYGDLARFLYENMHSKAAADPCVEGFGKADKALHCSKDGNGQYQCDVGYDFLHEQLVRSDVTC